MPGAAALRAQACVVAAAFGLLWAALLLTAGGDERTTWSRLVTDTLVLALASLLALALVRGSGSEPEDAARNARAALIALAGALFGLLLFWTGASVVLGTAVFLLAGPHLRPLAWTGAAIAALNALYFPVVAVLEYAPGVPG